MIACSRDFIDPGRAYSNANRKKGTGPQNVAKNRLGEADRAEIQRMIVVLKSHPFGIGLTALLRESGIKQTRDDATYYLDRIEHFALIWLDDGLIGLAE